MDVILQIQYCYLGECILVFLYISSVFVVV